MFKFYRRIAFLLILIGGISGVVIYFTVDINTLANLNSFQPWSVCAALLCLAVGLLLDGTRLMHLVNISGEKISLKQGMQVVFGNYFLALLTPGMTGGAVAQLMFLRRAGVPTGKATVFVVVRTLMSIVFLLVFMPLVLYFDPVLVPWISERTLLAIFVVLVACVAGGIALFRTDLPIYLLIQIAKRLSYARRRTAIAVYRDIRGAIFLLSVEPLGMLRVFVESGLSLVALYSVVPVLFIGMGADIHYASIMGRMFFLNLLLYFAPTPGGSGVAEGGFVLLFGQFLPAGTVGIAAVTWRMIAEYLPFAIGLYYTIRVFGHNFITKQMK